ncbi:prohibitin family protein [Caproiciproducens faecalis]|uniref:Prohibitin family protein n=1 Tax=Caproiciproducens faecalis TaxID=2820301 RepID=A0ABS7DJU5_9FIRM|nr:prohibitin family protein [Caproiciproducens faecalis]MBW7571367.1 prohibitin family protein [Caproiciproducens faecalis]
MIIILIGIVLSLAALVLFYIKTRAKIGLPHVILAVIPLLLSVAAASVAIIPANSVGVSYSPFNGVSENTLSEGVHFKGVFDKVYQINTEVQTKKLENISGQTKDAQYITMIIDVKYKVDRSKAFEVFKQYRNLENVSTNLIAPLVQRSIESVSTNYNIMEVLGEKRNNLYKEVETDLKARLAENGITFVSINFDDTDAGNVIEKAIQDEAVAKKAVETAEQEKLKAEVEAQKRVVEAQANKDKAKIEAETKLIQAQAEADSNKIISQSITPELLKRMEMEARQKFGWVTVQGGSVIASTPQNQDK